MSKCTNALIKQSIKLGGGLLIQNWYNPAG